MSNEKLGVENKPAVRGCVVCGETKPLTSEFFASDRNLKATRGFARKCRDCSCGWDKRRKRGG